MTKKFNAKEILPFFDNSEEQNMNERRISLIQQSQDNGLNHSEQTELKWLEKWANLVDETYMNRQNTRGR